MDKSLEAAKMATEIMASAYSGKFSNQGGENNTKGEELAEVFKILHAEILRSLPDEKG